MITISIKKIVEHYLTDDSKKRTATIYFVDDKFKSVTYKTRCDTYDRADWEFLADINCQIANIEEGLLKYPVPKMPKPTAFDEGGNPFRYSSSEEKGK